MACKNKAFNKGQGIVEYVLITALVALASIGMFRLFREDLQRAYQKAGEALVKGVDDSVAATSDTHG